MTLPPEQRPGSTEAERRRDPRAPISGRARVCLDEERSIAGEAVDISEAGVCLTLSVPLQVGSLYPIIVTLRSDSPVELSVIGRVCFSLERAGAYRVGISCAELGEMIRDAGADVPADEG